MRTARSGSGVPPKRRKTMRSGPRRSHRTRARRGSDSGVDKTGDRHVSGAVRDALTLGVIGFDAVKHLVLCRLDHRSPQLDLAQYPHLPAPRVTTTAAADYLTLLGAGAE